MHILWLALWRWQVCGTWAIVISSGTMLDSPSLLLLTQPWVSLGAWVLLPVPQFQLISWSWSAILDEWLANFKKLTLKPPFSLNSESTVVCWIVRWSSLWDQIFTALEKYRTSSEYLFVHSFLHKYVLSFYKVLSSVIAARKAHSPSLKFLNVVREMDVHTRMLSDPQNLVEQITGSIGCT